MTETIRFETEFVVPDDMDEQNVRHILNQFFVDLVRTDRFVDARIVEDATMEQSEEERLLEMLQEIDAEGLDQLDSVISGYTDE